MATAKDVPKYDSLMKPTIEALRALGGSASNEELHDWIADHLKLDDEQRSVLHSDGRMTALRYRLHWARTYLKKVGAVDNSARGVWTLTDAGRRISDVEIAAAARQVRMTTRLRRKVAEEESEDGVVGVQDAAETELAWTERLLEVMGEMNPSAFERLCQRILRESGFTRVDVTGRSGDGGIDGIGVLRVNLVSFHVLFQCKRWKGSVGAGVIRDFRGAMVGRADKGLVMTTGAFTADARREATRDGAPAIDLVDGETLCSLLKDLKLGVNVRLVEEVEVDSRFFLGV